MRKQVEHKVYRTKQKWRAVHTFMTSAAGEGIRITDNSTWRDKVMDNFTYYYDLEEVHIERTVYQPKATSAGMASTGFVTNVMETSARGIDFAVADVFVPMSSNKTPDTEAARANTVPDSVLDNLDQDGVYTTRTVRSHLTSNLSKLASIKTVQRMSKNLSNKKGRTDSTTTTVI